ncbi:unnamed protein product [Prorocentrum cordatum]|uniref:Phospholipase B-like n=1 Tax=Prorocentrum cordatum TaxID=2364126 RepID=A0ABN9RU67_9DINO|nr:unnamed protein product [Polarella glacialis]
MGTFHASGVPYIAHRDDWDWLAPGWASITARLHEHSPSGYYVDMFGWSLANAHKGHRQFMMNNLIAGLEINDVLAISWTVFVSNPFRSKGRTATERRSSKTQRKRKHCLARSLPHVIRHHVARRLRGLERRRRLEGGHVLHGHRGAHRPSVLLSPSRAGAVCPAVRLVSSGSAFCLSVLLGVVCFCARLLR